MVRTLFKSIRKDASDVVLTAILSAIYAFIQIGCMCFRGSLSSMAVWKRPIRWFKALVSLSGSYHRLMKVEQELAAQAQLNRSCQEKLNRLNEELERVPALLEQFQALNTNVESVVGDTHQLNAAVSEHNQWFVDHDRRLKAHADQLEWLNAATERLKKLDSAFSQDPHPFCHHVVAPNYLGEAEKQVGQSVAGVSEKDRNTLFYSYYSEIYGDTTTVLRQHYENYLPFLSKGSVLDIGCGAGELLEYACEHGIEAVGVDLDENEVARCQAKGLDVTCQDASAFLQCSSRTFGAVTMLQVIEHIDWHAIQRLIASVYQSLDVGGCFIVETINIRHPLAFDGFYTDPTHQLPISDTLLVFCLQWHGFKDVQLLRMMPVPVQGVPHENPEQLYYNYAVVGTK